MRYSTYNAIPQYPKSKKHPYETLENCDFFSPLIFHHKYLDECYVLMPYSFYKYG